MIEGEKVSLIPMNHLDKEWFFQLATASDGSEFWYGEKCGNKIPTKAAFFKDFHDDYFTDDMPHSGRCYKIVLKGSGEVIGQINYNKIQDSSTEFDIIIGSKHHFGKAYGSDAMHCFFRFLKQTLDIKKLILEVIEHNPRAIKAYEKLGFKTTGKKNIKNPFWIIMERDL